MESRFAIQKKSVQDFRASGYCIYREKDSCFCDSEFWHGYNWEVRKNDIKSNREFWIPKIERNMERDFEVTAKLEAEGWKVLRLWGNEIKKNAEGCADIIEKAYKESN